MARELGLNPRKLSRHVPSPAQRWKLPVGAWVRELYGKRHGISASKPRRAPHRRPEHAQEPDLSFDDGFETFQDDALRLDPDPTQIEDEDRYRLRHREAFRRAADYVAAAFARLTFVQRIVLFGSVAQPPRRDTHESKDVDLAVWVSEVSDLKALQRARGGALNDLLADFDMGVAHHQVDVFLFESRTDRYLGRLCLFGVCPKDKPECRVAGCGAALFLRQHDGFVFDARSLEHGMVLFDRAKGLLPPDDDHLPF